MTSPYHPQANGSVERLNRTIGQALATWIAEDRTNWDDLLPWVLYYHRLSKHASTLKSPFQVVTGRDPRDVPPAGTSTKRLPRMRGPFIVTEKLSSATVRVAHWTQANSKRWPRRDPRESTCQVQREARSVGNWAFRKGRQLCEGVGGQETD